MDCEGTEVHYAVWGGAWEGTIKEATRVRFARERTSILGRKAAGYANRSCRCRCPLLLERDGRRTLLFSLPPSLTFSLVPFLRKSRARVVCWLDPGCPVSCGKRNDCQTKNKNNLDGSETNQASVDRGSGHSPFNRYFSEACMMR